MVAYARFILRILRHKWFVLVYGIQIGGIPLWQLIIHDLSNFSRAEFKSRFRFQILNEITFDSREFQAVCDHHHARNPHHWQHWMKCGAPQPMPEVYVREMVADWCAAQKTYGTELMDWFVKEYPTMRLHPETLARLVAIMATRGITIILIAKADAIEC